MTYQGVFGMDGVFDYDVAAGGVDFWVAEEHGEGDGLAAHPDVGFEERLFDETLAAEGVGDANLGDAADAQVATGGGDELVVNGDVGDEVAGRCADEPAVGGGLADVTAGVEDGLVREGGEEEAPEFVVFGGGDFGVEAVDDGSVPGGRGRHGMERRQFVYRRTAHP